MYKINPISESQIDICNKCRDCIADKGLKNKFDATISHICNSATLYNSKGVEGKLYELQANNKMIGKLTKDEIIKMYTYRFSAKKSKARLYYDMIKSISSICPYCGIGLVSTLDHYLPKNEYPDYSITIYNLVPSCKDCNFNKKGGIVFSNENHLFHPYYDEIDASDWLKLNINEEKPLIINYFIDSENNNDVIMHKRLYNQFKTLNLFNLYNVYALNEICERYDLLKECFLEQGSEALSSELKKISRSISPNKNLWKHVLYRDLSINNWFCNNYFCE